MSKFPDLFLVSNMQWLARYATIARNQVNMGSYGTDEVQLTRVHLCRPVTNLNWVRSFVTYLCDLLDTLFA